MDLEEKVFNEILDKNEFTKKMKTIMANLYMRAYHHGRHVERDRLVNSEFLIIDPHRFEDLKYQAKNPCEHCVERADYLKIGCKANPKECELKQKQIRALEILTHFKTWK